MKMSFLKYIWFLGIILWLGCNKIDVPEPVEEAPVFYFNFDLENTNTSLSTGQSNYLMDANYVVPANGILQFIGTLKPKDCRALCPGSLRIIIRDKQKFDASGFDVSNALTRKKYRYQWKIRRDSVSIHFMNETKSETPFKSQWNLGNGVTTSTTNPTMTFGRKPFRVGLNVVNQAGCESTQIQSFNIEKGSHCRSFIVPGTSTNQRVLEVRSIGKPPFSYTWNTGATDSLILLNSISSTSLRKSFKVTVTDAEGCESVSGFNLAQTNADVNSLKAICIADFKSDIKFVSNTVATSGAGLISIDYMDQEGAMFSSQEFRQPDDAFFEIISVEDFSRNDRNQSVKKLGIQFSCNLYGTQTNREIKIRNAKGFMAVAYPD